MNPGLSRCFLNRVRPEPDIVAPRKVRRLDAVAYPARSRSVQLTNAASRHLLVLTMRRTIVRSVNARTIKPVIIGR